MTSYSRIFYEVYDPATGRALATPVDYRTARDYADESGGTVRFARAQRLTRAKAKPDFFDDEISRAIRMTEIVCATDCVLPPGHDGDCTDDPPLSDPRPDPSEHPEFWRE